MTPERLEKLDRLLEEVLSRSPGEHTEFLDQACAGDPETRRKVESLIFSYQRADSIFETPALEQVRTIFENDFVESMVGQVLGPYRIGELIGSGGMGEVYLAKDELLDKKVAIKFLATYLQADELARKRLIREARAVAKLDHPNICAIHAVGQEADQVYLVMQYIGGESLATRVQRARLELREAVEVAIKVADALSHAHSRGIIHRDIKPHNIMITPEGQVKVLDFGLAKMALAVEAVIGSAEGGSRPEQVMQSDLSVPGMRAGTAAYMSPEQAMGSSVDARCDLFSLGVTLYESVAGATPFSGSDASEIRSRVMEFDPPPLSETNSDMPLELDQLLAKALAKEPDLRYQSAAEMLEGLRAVRRLLQDEPAPPTPLAPDIWAQIGVAAKMLLSVMRKPRALLSASLLMLVIGLLILPSVLAWLHFKPPSATTLYWYSEGTRSLRNGSYYAAAKALERAVNSDGGYALAHARLAQAYTELDYSDKASSEIHYAASLLTGSSWFSSLDRLYLQAITNEVSRAFAPAIESYQEIKKQSPDAEKPHALVDLGRAYEKDEQIEKAIASYLDATKLAPSDATAFLRLGILYGRQQNLEGSRDAFQKAESLYQDLSDLEGVTEVFYQRGFLFLNLMRLPEARLQLEEALKIANTTGNQYQRINITFALSSVAAAQGLATQAEKQATQAMELARADGMETQATWGLIWLGNAFFGRGDYDAAEESYKHALELARRDNGRLNEALALVMLGSLRSQQNNVDEALGYIEQALPFYQKGGYRKWLSQVLMLLGRIYRQKGDCEVARSTFNEQLQLAEREGDLSQVAFSHGEIGSVLAIQEQYTDALRHFDESYKVNKSLKAVVAVAYAAIQRSSVLWEIGRYDEARAALEEAYSVAQGPDGSHTALLADIHLIHARLELSLRNFRESKVQSRQAIVLAGTQYMEIGVQARRALGLALARSGGPRAGKLLCRQALDLATQVKDQQLRSGASLAYAEALLESGEAQRALEAALEAQSSLARLGQQDSEWKAWLIAARANRLLGEARTASECASLAYTQLSGLEQRWGPEAYAGYIARPDIQNSRKQLDQVLR